MVSSENQKKSYHSLLAAKLSKLTIPSSSPLSSSPPTSAAQDFDFNDVFGPPTPSTSTSNPFHGDPLPQVLQQHQPLIIHNRSHSFVGPSPRYAPAQTQQFDLELDEDEEEDEEDVDQVEESNPESRDPNDVVCGEKTSQSPVGSSNVKIGPGDFEIMRVVGKGAFGKVFQVRKKNCCNGDGNGGGDGIYAMKVMRKDTIIKKNHVDYMRAERDILTKVVHPFIVPLRYSFQTKSKLYLILDFVNGGHLFFQLYRQGIFSEDDARFYTAEIVTAVSHLHKCGIVHRDLKPENILMDADGHILLTDFGLAKEIDESSRSNSMCGTTEYMAPEILQSKGHNKDADWWSVGILLYEMLTGQPPYTHENRKKLQEKIIKEKMKLPPYLTSGAHSLLKGLLQKEPSRRLGSGPTGGDEIKAHKWFQTINWKKLEAREITPKFKPEVNGKDCIANFDKCWTVMPLVDSPASTPTTGEHFQGYTYVAPNPWLSSDST
ncbi:serine/threonine-protein kinase AtPK1/AtPK6-like [Humulus lupulus]|uniref:serine/threonine-protein kinase AtPK1/AtPK6-like n=1 Tax=Humulus lupulus TaxID=3486 RepID=UPI002B407BC7|nr:serine/threonine-protein kinase AtPK1/AtPK6-like [Humulus lupulus]